MLLKESFRYQNFLTELIRTTTSYLCDCSVVMTTKEEHMRKKANPEAEDETIIVEKTVEYTANDLISFIMYLLAEKEKLTIAISKAKKSVNFDVDAAVANNSTRQIVTETLSLLTKKKPSEFIKNCTGYKFNAEGNQVPYQYQAKVVSTIDFDRNKVKKLSKDLSVRADEVSTDIDKAMLEIEVDYEPEFNVNDSYEDVIETFLDKSRTD